MHLTAREMAVLRRCFEAAGGGGVDIPAVMRFFGRDGPQQPPAADDADQPAGVDASGQGETDKRKDELKKAPHPAEDENSRLTSEVEVGRKKRAENTTALPERFLAVSCGGTHPSCVYHPSSLHFTPSQTICF